MNTTRTIQKAYDHWIQANKKARYYMLASMPDVLRIKCEKMETTYEIMESLHEIFGQPSDELHHDAFKAAMNTKMKVETSVREHRNLCRGYEIMESLHEIFGQPSDELHHDAFKAAMNTKMKVETSVREH